MPSVLFSINGKIFEVAQESVHVTTSLLEFIRSTALLTGTKAGCGTGGCGACTVMISRDRDAHVSGGSGMSKIREHVVVNACSTPVLSLHGNNITTVEGIGTLNAPHPIQSRFAQLHAQQCGFCTSGMIMSLYALLVNNPQPRAQEVETVFNGNLCRCTGYRPLLDAAKSFSVDIEDLLSAREAQRDGKDNPTSQGYYPPLSDNAVARETSTSLEKIRSIRGRVNLQPGLHLRPLQLPQESSAGPFPDPPTSFSGSHGSVWLHPRNLEQFFSLTKTHPDFFIISGNAGFNQARKARQTCVDSPNTALVYTANIKECSAIGMDSSSFDVTVGSSVVLSVIADEFLNKFAQLPEIGKQDPWMQAALREIALTIQLVGSSQSRNATTLCGHILSRHNSDLGPLLSVLKTTALVLSDEGRKKLSIQDLAGSSRLIRPKDFVVELTIPAATNRFVGISRGAMRHDNSAGQIVVAMSCEVHRTKENDIIAVDVRLSCGGLYHLLDLSEVAAIFEGMSLLADNSLRLRHSTEKFQHLLRNVANQPEDGRLSYRMSVGKGLIFRLYWKLLATCNIPIPTDRSALNVDSTTFPQVSDAVQSWEVTKGNIHDSKLHLIASSASAERSPVGDPIPNITALALTTGNAIYVDDVPSPQGCLHAALVKSTIARGVIKNINAAPALAIPGVVGFYSYADIPNKQLPKTSPYKEHAFCDGEVVSIGDVIGVVVASDHHTAARAAQLVQVNCIPDPNPLVTIEDAIAANSFYDFPNNQIVEGDLEKSLHDKKLQRLAGTLCIGGQEHFYLEPHALLVVPGENNEIEVISMTQCVTKTQNQVAQVLGIPASRVTVKVKRIGGAFGGKEVRTTYTSATLAVPATILRRPVRWAIDREEDMKITGGRHPYRAEWRVSFDHNGSIHALDVRLYSNGGCSESVTSDAMTRSLMHITNAYKIPSVRVRGFLCKTNIVSNTAFRGFGAPQAMLVVDTVLEAIAQHLSISVDVLRERHLMQPNSVTHYGQQVEHCKLPFMWKELVVLADYANRKASIEAFNAASRWVKRGISILPTMYGISFPIEYLNQGGALVCVYSDGSVAVSHSAVEMGQGINTKVAQVAARVFGIPVSAIRITECASDKVPNTPPTAASMGSDLACTAVMDACEKIVENLKPLRDAKPGLSFGQLAELAFKSRIPLSATGFFKTTRGAKYDWKAPPGSNGPRGSAYAYHVFGVGASEVELDVLTGHFKVLRTDLLMDVGDTLNAQIDIGQVEGSFVQGMGWLTTEELIFGDSQHPAISPTGTLFNASANAYKIPTAFDVPKDFRVSFLSGAPNPFAVHGSKAVGEPPLYLAATVPMAIKDAIYAARASENLSGFASLDFPLTSERIRLACRDDFTLGTFATEEFRAAGSF